MKSARCTRCSARSTSASDCLRLSLVAGWRCKLILMRYVLLVSIATCLAAQNNTLTPAEKAAGWKLLFDGKSFNGWVDPSKKTPPGDSWTIDGDAIKAKPDPRITEDLFTTE